MISVTKMIGTKKTGDKKYLYHYYNDIVIVYTYSMVKWG